MKTIITLVIAGFIISSFSLAGDVTGGFDKLQQERHAKMASVEVDHFQK